MSNKKEIWAIQHIGYEDLGSFADVIKSRGFEIKYFCSKNTDYSKLSASSPDLLIILGGPMAVYSVDENPWIASEQQFISDRIKCNKPLMGICFGAQIIAQAIGGKAYRGSQGKEIGWSQITVNEDGMKTAMKHFDGQLTNMMHWHGDTFDLPDSAILLASSDKYHKQAYMYGDHVFALQCHPEVTPDKLKIWYKDADNQTAEVGTTIDELKADADLYNQQLMEQSKKFLNQWMDEQGL